MCLISILTSLDTCALQCHLILARLLEEVSTCERSASFDDDDIMVVVEGDSDSDGFIPVGPMLRSTIGFGTDSYSSSSDSGSPPRKRATTRV